MVKDYLILDSLVGIDLEATSNATINGVDCVIDKLNVHMAQLGNNYNTGNCISMQGDGTQGAGHAIQHEVTISNVNVSRTPAAVAAGRTVRALSSLLTPNNSPPRYTQVTIKDSRWGNTGIANLIENQPSTLAQAWNLYTQGGVHSAIKYQNIICDGCAANLALYFASTMQKQALTSGDNIAYYFESITTINPNAVFASTLINNNAIQDESEWQIYNVSASNTTFTSDANMIIPFGAAHTVTIGTNQWIKFKYSESDAKWVFVGTSGAIS